MIKIKRKERKKEEKKSWVQCHVLVIPALGRQGQAEHPALT